jgi:hypothetical protein
MQKPWKFIIPNTTKDIPTNSTPPWIIALQKFKIKM